MKFQHGFVLSALLAMLIGCANLQSPFPAPEQPTPSAQLWPMPTPPKERPGDFSILYRWSTGTVAPPYYYKYSIMINSSGQGEIQFIPNYPQEDDQLPVWVEPFSVSDQDLDQLYQLMHSQGLWSYSWRDLGDPPVGAGSQSMAVTADGLVIETSAYLSDEQDKQLEEIYTAVKALVPKDIWEGLMAKRDKYIEEYENSGG